MTKVGKLLRELITLPSVNPAFLPSDDPRSGEHQVAQFLADRAERNHLEVEFQAVFPQRNNVWIRWRPDGKIRHRLLLAPHLDTVGGDERITPLFVPRQKQGRLYGRGACDTKGSVASMFEALCRLATSRQRPQHTEIVMVGLVDEEFNQAGSRAVVQNHFTADLAIVGEPTRLKVVTAHKGLLWMHLQTRGKEAHGARPELGQNAVHTMARVVDLLLTDYCANLEKQRHPLLGHASLNVGQIQGGRQPNIVPAECITALDRRTLPGEKDAQVLSELRSWLREQGFKVTLQRHEKDPCLPMEADPQLPWIQHLMRHARQKAPCGVDYFTDAGVLAQGGIPSVVFGPGNIAQAHTPDEWIDLKQLDQATAILFDFLQSLP